MWQRSLEGIVRDGNAGRRTPLDTSLGNDVGVKDRRVRECTCERPRRRDELADAAAIGERLAKLDELGVNANRELVDERPPIGGRDVDRPDLTPCYGFERLLEVEWHLKRTGEQIHRAGGENT